MGVEPVCETDIWGNNRWYLNERLHREDGPAVIYANGTQLWYIDGNMHRINGPAVIHPDDTQEWCVNNQRHRIDGPAVIHPDDTQEWFINDMDITDDVEQWMTLKEITWPWDEETQVDFQLTWA